MNKCVEVMTMYSDRKGLPGETDSHMCQQLIYTHYFAGTESRGQMEMRALGSISIVHAADHAKHIVAKLLAERGAAGGASAGTA